jgi:hypothetical protein
MPAFFVDKKLKSHVYLKIENNVLMAMKSILASLVMICVSQQPVSAQSTLGLRMWSPQFSNFTNSSQLNQTVGNTPFQERSSVGILVGLSYRRKIEKQHYLTLEFLYSMRGQSSRYKAYQLDGYNVIDLFGGDQSYIEYIQDYRTHYIELPVLYTLNLTGERNSKVSVYLSSGFSAGINVVGHLRQNSFKLKSPGSMLSGIDENFTNTEIPEVNPFILNLVTDFECEFRKQKKAKYFLYGRANQAITNVFSASYSTTKLTTLGFGFGMRWTLQAEDKKS